MSMTGDRFPGGLFFLAGLALNSPSGCEDEILVGMLFGSTSGKEPLKSDIKPSSLEVSDGRRRMERGGLERELALLWSLEAETSEEDDSVGV